MAIEEVNGNFSEIESPRKIKFEEIFIDFHFLENKILSKIKEINK